MPRVAGGEPRLRAAPARGRPAARRLFAVAALLSAAFTVGCWRPLAHQHEYFAPWSGSASRIGAETRHTVSHYRALQAASHACAPWSPAAAGLPPAAVALPPAAAALPSPPPSGAKAVGRGASSGASHGTNPGAKAGTSPPGGPAQLRTSAPGAAAAPEALADLCASPARPDVAAYGGASNAYGRWVRDEVRKLPAASRTAASAAGGS